MRFTLLKARYLLKYIRHHVNSRGFEFGIKTLRFRGKSSVQTLRFRDNFGL